MSEELNVPDVRLTPDNVAALQSVAGPLRQVRALLKRAERAGLPVDDLKALADRLEAQRVGMLREFGPHTTST